jgi:hypothetical protein
MADDPYEYWRDLARAVPTSVVQDLVRDFRNYSPTPRPDPSAKVIPQGAGKVVGGDDGVAHRAYQPTEDTTDRSGWRDAPQLKPPPGIDLIDQMVAAQDERDLIERAKQMAAAKHARSLVEAEQQEAELKQKEKGKE